MLIAVLAFVACTDVPTSPDDSGPVDDTSGADDSDRADDTSEGASETFVTGQGGTLGGFALDEVVAWALTEDGDVVFAQRHAGEVFAPLIGRERDGAIEVLLTPEEVAGSRVGSTPAARIDESGHVWLWGGSGGCVGLWDGSELVEVGCDVDGPLFAAGGRALTATGPGTSSETVRLLSADGVTPIVARGDTLPGPSPLRTWLRAEELALHPDGSVAMRAYGRADNSIRSGDVHTVIVWNDGSFTEWAWAAYGGGEPTSGRLPSPTEYRGNTDLYFRHPVFSPEGHLALQWFDLGGDPSSPRAASGVWTVDSPTGDFVQRLSLVGELPGGEAPIGLYGTGYTTPAVVAQGRDGVFLTAFARFDESNQYASSAVWRDDGAGDGLKPVVQSGDPAVDARGRPIDGWTVSRVGNLVASDDGAAAFVVQVDGTDAEGQPLEGDATLRVYGLTAPPDARLRELAALGDPMPDGQGVVQRIELHSREVMLPESRSWGSMGIRGSGVGRWNSLQAWGSPGTGRTVDGDGCGEVVMHLVGYNSSALMRLPIDPECL